VRVAQPGVVGADTVRDWSLRARLPGGETLVGHSYQWDSAGGQETRQGETVCPMSKFGELVVLGLRRVVEIIKVSKESLEASEVHVKGAPLSSLFQSLAPPKRAIRMVNHALLWWCSSEKIEWMGLSFHIYS
jgi:hypothetical protein